MDLNKYRGLSQLEADNLLKENGFNETPSQKKQSVFALFIKIIKEPMFLLLIASGTIYLFIGELGDSLMLILAIVVVVAITFYQERKTEKTLEALKNLSSPRALVIRDGEQKRIAGKEVVKEDIIIIHEGDRIPADAVVLFYENLSVDESLLTGESIPVRKVNWDGKIEQTIPGGDDTPFIYSGSLVVSGRGIARVKSTGIKTEIGKIGKSLENIKEEDTLLHKETSKIVRYAAFISIFLCLFVVSFYILIKGEIVNGLLSGLTLGMAILPEEFPVVLIIFLTLGAWRISKKNVLTRRSAAIETLGAATVLCVDKTGTLTLNKMKLTTLYTHNSFYDIDKNLQNELPTNFHELLEYGMMANKKDPFDPLEKELNRVGEFYIKNPNHLNNDWGIVKEFPLTKELLALSHIWKVGNKDEFVLASKGAPEAVFNLCHMEDEEKNKILKKVHEMSEHGLRVLGVAKGIFNEENIPENQHDFNFEFVGLVGFIDPIRDSAENAIKESYEAGMRVIMITGDYSGTAQFIARKIGIKNPENFITGEVLSKMNNLELIEKIKTTNIFARIVPEQKLKIINALKANGEIVAMTGDGVNDAPALKSAHIGIAMGERGTDVAREASALVLLDDDFSSIVEAIKLGRRIYDNLKRAMGYILAVHVPIAGMSVLPLLFGYPIVLLPAHVAFLELIIDPACSTVFESEKGSKNIMKRPPRNLHQSIFNKKTVLIALLQGAMVLIVTFLLFSYAIKTGRSDEEARSFAFMSLVLSNILLITVNLSWDKGIYRILKEANRIFFFVFFGASFSLFAVLYVPSLSRLFHLAPLHPKDFILISLVAIVSVIWFELLKKYNDVIIRN